jgi:hypothetical protein
MPITVELRAKSRRDGFNILIANSRRIVTHGDLCGQVERACRVLAGFKPDHVRSSLDVADSNGTRSR